jgi:hypothetical protein
MADCGQDSLDTCNSEKQKMQPNKKAKSGGGPAKSDIMGELPQE